MILFAKEFVQLRTSVIPEDYHRAAHDEAPESVWLDVIREYPAMREWIPHNKTVPQNVLLILSEDQDPKVRMVVAGVRRAGEAILQRLAEDLDPSVRYAVAYNAKTPASVIEYLAKDQCEHIAARAKVRMSKQNRT